MKKIHYILLFLISFSINSQNNISNIDSLLYEVKKTKEDTLILKTYAKIGFKTIFTNKEKANKVIIEGKNYAKTVKNTHWIAELDNIHGVYYAVNEKYDSARFYYKKSLELSKKHKFKKIESKCVNNLGLAYWNLGEFDTALNYFFESLKIDEEFEDEKSSISALGNIGLIYQEMNQYKKGLEYQIKVYKIRKKYKDFNGLPISLNNIGICYRSLKKYDSAIEAFLEGIEYAKKSNNLLTLSKLYSNLANTYQNINQNKKSIEVRLESLKILKKFGEINKEYMFSYSGLVSSYNRINNLKKAKENSKKAFEILEQTPHLKNYSLTLLLETAETNFRIGNIVKGRKNFEEYNKIKDSIFSKKRSNSIADMEIKYKSEKKEKELLQTRTEKAETELALSRTKNWIYILLGSLGLLGMLFFGVNQRNKRKNQEKILKEKERGLKAMIDAQETERSRIARELHDGVVQQIGSIILKSRNYFSKSNLSDNKEPKELLESLENSNQDLRNISHQMMPRALKELGILPALNDLLEGSLSFSNIKYSLEHFNIDERLPEKIEITIYRITQELINNILKHSKASEVSVQLFNANNSVILIVEDDGVGFESKKSKKGIGLLNISSRLDMVNGNVNFEPSPKSGTLVTIKIPL
ncbi:tetratricopeptide repeat protein [Lutibacter sp. Hel_I_33_5]|uniref:tetratricopeptide repeat-containing sensor histidine kinase n=1 Tax=Lutibacter sp. Hel_I_33_5 TaxID=1566289 RepID=UPI00119FDFA5|nr:sensor histidine kinase [Lutibacter sp. Hel_I_33_5]TVZ56144.1 tetratricopeptide repeat protein [Lutibacter sp. Hel_I_33_5]